MYIDAAQSEFSKKIGTINEQLQKKYEEGYTAGYEEACNEFTEEIKKFIKDICERLDLEYPLKKKETK